MKKVLVILLALAMVLGLAACGGASSGGSSAPEKKEPQELIIAIELDQAGLDPNQVSWTDVPHLLTSGVLFSYNKDNTGLVPEICESIEVSEDGLRIDFTLPEGAKFSNGDPLTAQAVKDSLMRTKEISLYAEDLATLEDVEVTDDTHGALIMSEASPFMYASLVSAYGAIVDVQEAEKVGDDAFNAEGYVSCGPYVIDSWTAGSEMTFVPNPNYKTFNPEKKNQDATNLYDKITVRFIPDGFTRVSELQAGNVDIITSVGASDYETVLNDSSLKSYKYDYAGMVYAMFNLDDEITGDLKVRQAINLGIDRNAICEAMGNTCSPSYSMINSAIIGFSAEEDKKLADEWAYDPEKAAALLEEAGWVDSDGDGIRDKDGKPLQIAYDVAASYEAQAQSAPIIQEQLKQIGIDISVSVADSSVVKDKLASGDYQMACLMYGWNDADIMIYLRPLQGEEILAVLAEARVITDGQARIEKYVEAQELIDSYLPSFGLFYPNTMMATTDKITMTVYGDGRTPFEDIEKAE